MCLIFMVLLHQQIPRKFQLTMTGDCFKQGTLYRISATSSSDHSVYFSVDLLTGGVFIQHRIQVDVCCTVGTCAYDHTTLNTPVLVWSLKLSSVGLVQYLDGWLPRNHRLCLFMFSCFILFLFFWGAFFDFVLFVFFSVLDFWLCFLAGSMMAELVALQFSK